MDIGEDEEGRRLLGAVVRGPHGDDVGRVSGLLVDPDDQAAQWLAVALPAGGHAVVPASSASVDESVVTLPFDVATLSAAPSVATDSITTDQASALRRHYGFGDGR